MAPYSSQSLWDSSAVSQYSSESLRDWKAVAPILFMKDMLHTFHGVHKIGELWLNTHQRIYETLELWPYTLQGVYGT